jgi:hypothetical protein
MSRPLRIGLTALLVLACAGTLALGWAWHRDRTRHWEEPTLSDGTFTRLEAGQRTDSGGRATWMVPVNPRCPRCLFTLRRLRAEWVRRGCPERLIVLIVDARRNPGADLLRTIPDLPVWWDRDGVWRRRWGHRLYGELIEFDAAGRYLRTFPARDALPRLTSTAPGDSTAPARKGETES